MNEIDPAKQNCRCTLSKSCGYTTQIIRHSSTLRLSFALSIILKIPFNDRILTPDSFGSPQTLKISIRRKERCIVRPQDTTFKCTWGTACPHFTHFRKLPLATDKNFLSTILEQTLICGVTLPRGRVRECSWVGSSYAAKKTVNRGIAMLGTF